MENVLICPYCKNKFDKFNIYDFNSHLFNCKKTFLNTQHKKYNNKTKIIKKIQHKKYNYDFNFNIKFNDSRLELKYNDDKYFTILNYGLKKKQKYKIIKEKKSLPVFIQNLYNKTDNLNDFVTNKTLSLVGNFNIKYKFKEIEKSDYIIRINYLPTPKEYIHIGKRTDIYYCKINMLKLNDHNDIKFLCSLNPPINKFKNIITKFYNNNNKFKFHIVDLEHYNYLLNKLNKVSNEILVFLDILNTNFKSLNIIGINFDFLENNEKNFISNLLLLDNRITIDLYSQKKLYNKYIEFENKFHNDIFNIKHVFLRKLKNSKQNILFAFKNNNYSDFNGFIIRFDKHIKQKNKLRKEDIIIRTENKNINGNMIFILDLVNNINTKNIGNPEIFFKTKLRTELINFNIKIMTNKLFVLLYFILLFDNNIYIDDINFSNIYEELLIKYFIKYSKLFVY